MPQNMPVPGIGGPLSQSFPGPNAGFHSNFSRSRPGSSNSYPNATDYCAYRGGAGGGKMTSSLPGSMTNLGQPNNRLPSLRHSASSGNLKRADTASTYSKYFNSPRGNSSSSNVLPPPPGFLKRSSSEECIKCMMKIPHTKCEAHKYIRVGGGYRHSYWYVKAMMEEIELQRQKELLLQQRLEAIHEKGVRIIKTYIRTKSGRLKERIIYLSEEDYLKFKEGGLDAADILKKYLNKDEAENLHSWEKEEMKAVTTYIRTKSGRRVAKTLYVTKDEFDAMKSGEIDANAVLAKYLKPGEGETIEGWGEAEMKAVKTYVRTKSGRLVEKTILVSKEDYDKLMEAKAAGLGDEAMADILGKYMSLDEGAKIEGFEKKEAPPMKVVKAMVRTKSGRLVEKTILMTEEEYNAFQESGGDMNMLKKYLDLGKDDVLEGWEKASTVYGGDSDNEDLKKAKEGETVIGKDGQLYEVIVDPITGKKYMKKVSSKDEDAVVQKLKEGQRFVGKDGDEYEVVIDPKTGKKIKRKIDPDENKIDGGEVGERFVGKDGEEYEIVVDPKTGKKIKQKIDADEKEISKGKVGQRFVGKDGEEYEIVEDPITGKKVKKLVQSDEQKLSKGKVGERFVGKDGEEYEIVVDPKTGKKIKKKIDADEKKILGGKAGERFIGADGEEYEIEVDPRTGKKVKKKVDRDEKKILAGKVGERFIGDDGEEYEIEVDPRTGKKIKKKIDVDEKKILAGEVGERFIGDDGEEYEIEVDPKTGKKTKKKVDQDDVEIQKGKVGERFVGKDGEEYEIEIDPKTGKKIKKKVDVDDKQIKGGKEGERFVGKDGEEYEILVDPVTGKKYKKKISKLDDKAVERGKVGQKFVGEDGEVYEIAVDPVTGKKFKKRIHVDEEEKKKLKGGGKDVPRGKIGKGKIMGAANGDPNEKGMSKEEVAAYRGGKRRSGSDSDFSYRSVVSAGGTRHVRRKKKRADGTYSDSESYHSDQDEAGKKRRQGRRATRKAAAIKQKAKALKEGKRNADSDSDFSYRSVVSAGGTRHVKRRRKRADGTYSDSESYNSDKDPEGKARRKKRREQRVEAFRKGKRNPDSDSDFSYRSVVSAGGTRHVKRRRKRDDGTYSDSESYHSDQDAEGKKRRRGRREQRQKAYKVGKRNPDSDSDFSYKSFVSDGGTRHVRRKKKHADGTYSDSASYHSSQDEDGLARRRRRRRDRKHAGSANSYYSVISDGGTRHVKRRRKRADGTYSDSESYHSGDSNFFDKKKLKDKRRKVKHEHGSDSDHSYYSEVSEGGTRHQKRKERIRDKDGKVIGYGKAEDYSSPSEYETDPDQMTDFSGSLASTDPNDEPDLSKMTEAERTKYLEDKAVRQAEREKKRREKYGDKYDEMMDKHSKAKDAKVKDMIKKKELEKKKGNDADDESEYSTGGYPVGETPSPLSPTPSPPPPAHVTRTNTMDTSTNTDFPTSYSRQTSARTVPSGRASGAYPWGRRRPRVQASGCERELSVVGQGPSLPISETIDKPKPPSSLGEPRYSATLKSSKRSNAGPITGDYINTRPVNLDKLLRKSPDLTPKLKKSGQQFTIDDFLTLKTDDALPAVRPFSFTRTDTVDSQGRIRKKKKKGAKDDDEESVYDYERDAEGNIVLGKDGKPVLKKIGTIKKGMKKGKPGDKIDSDDEFEYRLDEQGNVIRKKKGQDEDSDGDYFETLADGTVVLKKGKKKIDISKLSLEDLKKLGIDPKNMTKEEIARILKEKFGDDIQIVRGGRKIGLKNAEEYSNADTDDLAGDDDLDTSTLRGQRRVRVLMKRGGQQILDHLKKLIEDSLLTDEQHVHPDEEEASIDFLQHYRLVDSNKLETYARAFVVEDDLYSGAIYPREAKLALEGVPFIQDINAKQMEYILSVLDIDRETNVTFRMFAVMTALAERVTHMDKYCQNLLNISNLADIERKMDLYKQMFYCNIPGDRDPNYIKSESLKIELIAGGLSWDQQDYVMERMKPNEWREVSFLDYLAYIPLFMSMHDNVCDNPLDMSNSKYSRPKRQPSAQRDMNPLGNQLNKKSAFMAKNTEVHKEAKDLLTGKKPDMDKNREILNKYQKLPNIVGVSPGPGVKKK